MNQYVREFLFHMTSFVKSVPWSTLLDSTNPKESFWSFARTLLFTLTVSCKHFKPTTNDMDSILAILSSFQSLHFCTAKLSVPDRLGFDEWRAVHKSCISPLSGSFMDSLIKSLECDPGDSIVGREAYNYYLAIATIPCRAVGYMDVSESVLEVCIEGIKKAVIDKKVLGSTQLHDFVVARCGMKGSPVEQVCEWYFRILKENEVLSFI
jgi:hypothetical protein